MRFSGVVWAILTANQLTAVGLPALAQVSDSSSNVKAVMKAEQTWWKGGVTGDTIPMARLMAPDSILLSRSRSSRSGDPSRDDSAHAAGEHEELSIGRFVTTARPLWLRRTIESRRVARSFGI